MTFMFHLDLNLLSWIFAIVGVVGVGGLIALAVFAPAVAQVVMTIIIDFFKAVLSTRLGVGIVVGLVCLVGGDLYGNITGRNAAETQCQQAQLKADAEAKARDQTITNQAGTDAQKRMAQLELENQAYQTQTKAYADEIDKRNKAAKAPSGCVLSPADIKRLR